MAVTAIEGIVENGKIRLSDDVLLPENTKVYVLIAELANQPIAHLRSPRLVNPNQAADFRKQIVESGDDAKI